MSLSRNGLAFNPRRRDSTNSLGRPKVLSGAGFAVFLGMSLNTARSIFRNMPDEVFDMWIAPLIGDHGWPFRSATDSTTGTHWHRYFAERGIQVIAQLRWNRREMPFASVRFHPVSQSTIDALRRHHTFGIWNSQIAALKDSAERFTGFQKLVQRDGRIPAPCVLMCEALSYTILDGHHRIAALASMPSGESFTLDAWIGSLQPESAGAPSQIGEVDLGDLESVTRRLDALRQKTKQPQQAVKRIAGRDLARKPPEEI